MSKEIENLNSYKLCQSKTLNVYKIFIFITLFIALLIRSHSLTRLIWLLSSKLHNIINVAFKTVIQYQIIHSPGLQT